MNWHWNLILIFTFISVGCTQCLAQSKNVESIKINSQTSVQVTSPWRLIEIDSDASLRGLHVFSEKEIFASGTSGTIVSSIDGGQNWKVRQIEGAEQLDFRDIHALDDATLIAMSSGTPACIYRSTNGGLSWKQVFKSDDPKVFLDCMSFWDSQNGVIMGDPINGVLFLLTTSDGGRNWKQVLKAPATIAGEAGFAASGSNMITKDGTLMIALGSAEPKKSFQTSRILFSSDRLGTWKSAKVPMPRDPSSGIFSIHFVDNKNGIAVGGNYQQPDSTLGNYAITRDGGMTWRVPKKGVPPTGYRSCVAHFMKGREITLVAVGPNGTDISGDLGDSWRRVSNHGFHSVEFSPDGRSGWATGSDGRIAKWLGKGK
ncbi:MAG: YCF48-related protein [Planctomycetota bacterium]